MGEAPQKKKVAIIGAGLGGLSAAWALLRSERFTVDIYEAQDRPGGKGRTHRDEPEFAPIEHGLHAFGGYYHNTFFLLRKVLQGGVRDHLKPQHEVEFPVIRRDAETMVTRRWSPWEEEDETPGWDEYMRYEAPVAELVARLFEYLQRLRSEFESTKSRPMVDMGRLRRKDLPGSVARLIEAHRSNAGSGFLPGPDRDLTALDVAARIARGLPGQPRRSFSPDERGALAALARWSLGEGRVAFAEGPVGEPELLEDAERLCLACAVGILATRADRKGLQSLDCLDFREFLRRYGGEGVEELGLVRGIYDYVFAYRGGDRDRPALAAGVAIRMILLFFLDSRGAVQWHMVDGMGDSVVMPLYQELTSSNDCRFHHHHRLVELVCSDGAVAELRFKRRSHALPIVSDEGDANRCYWGALQISTDGHEEVTKSDYDAVVLAIPPLAQAGVVPERLTRGWAKMMGPELSVQTLSAQLWGPDAQEFGNVIRVGGGCGFPSVADMSHQLASSKVEGTDRRLYFFVEATAAGGVTEASVRQRVRETAGFEGYDPDRMHFQQNSDPSDLYVLTPPGPRCVRPGARVQGASNLVLAGDWVRTGLGFGCAEAAVASGFNAANALRRQYFPGDELLPVYNAGGPFRECQDDQ
ncbi:MAG: FAD-dependent oxidoreductase [Polyangiaceae bacterium]|nr:FAD-dependent oxidoreductase [Polyangiaceae bacterium]MCB9649380.1 FAD-dependent oxidoreductase [Deltaproteobacteria bacterium]